MLRDGRTIAVAEEQGCRVQLLRASDGGLLRSVGGEGKELGAFRFPLGVCGLPNGGFVVCDRNNHRIQFFDQHCVARHSITDFRNPCAVALDGDGNVLVVEQSSDRITVLTRGGRRRENRLLGLATSGKQKGVGVRPEDGCVVVMDGQNNRLILCEPPSAVRYSAFEWERAGWMMHLRSRCQDLRFINSNESDIPTHVPNHTGHLPDTSCVSETLVSKTSVFTNESGTEMEEGSAACIFTFFDAPTNVFNLITCFLLSRGFKL